ncbi:MAG: bifunctional hydroxymethylpyrimidine kinase/phosphomethylpyrimidine kinase, partial [Methanobacteriota archaeon]
CTLSAAIAANLAKGLDIEKAVKNAKTFVLDAIRHALSLGHGVGPVNPVAKLQNEAEKFCVYQQVYTSAKRLASIPNAAKHIPEVSSNLVMALPHARSVEEVFGFPSRIIRVENHVVLPSCPKLGGSNHMARLLLAAMGKHPEIRAALNIRYSKETLEKAEKLGFTITGFSREDEPADLAGKEGKTLSWGVQQALAKVGKAPDIIYDKGGVGKEPMIRILGRTAEEVVEKFRLLALDQTQHGVPR